MCEDVQVNTEEKKKSVFREYAEAIIIAVLLALGGLAAYGVLESVGLYHGRKVADSLRFGVNLKPFLLITYRPY